MFEQVKLPYSFDALEPFIDTATMETHYGKHHAAYTKVFSEAAAKAGLEGKSAEEILSDLESVPDAALRKVLRNNGGGYLNHNIYFEALSPSPKKAPEGKLAECIDKTFGSLDALKEKLTAAALGQFGSGWAWLTVSKKGELEVVSTPNQDNPYSLDLGTPLVALDVWEHAYYLKYRNLRGEYIKNFFEVLDWSVAEKRFAAV
ncbi:MAG: superoxide dismutase [Oscillospiraceae bacterium]|nr:superoxide dismutase [Oscillospiraceae bacterium]